MPSMETRSIAAIRYLEASELRQWLRQGFCDHEEPFQVIDVRGGDYIGGHIKGGWNYPYRELRDDDSKAQQLLQRLREQHGTKVVNCVFHCALSQQRGPSAALKFLRSVPDSELSKLRIWVLRGGFNHWQSLYGEDASVTEGFQKDLWRM